MENRNYLFVMMLKALFCFLQPDLGPSPDVVLGKAVGMNEWMGFINSEGKIQNVEELKRLIHTGVGQCNANHPSLQLSTVIVPIYEFNNIDLLWKE
jgi:hypothetical protein